MILFPYKNDYDSVAQLVEQMPFKHWVLGSNPSRVIQNTYAERRYFVNQTPGFEGRESLDVIAAVRSAQARTQRERNPSRVI